MSCELCKKIWDSIDAYQGNFTHPWEEKIGIVTQWEEPWLYVPCEGDDYFSDAVMQINYCPKCGRKLIENKAYKVNDHMIRVAQGDDFIVDYFKDRGTYRVSVFEDCHFKDEYWFDAYEEKEVGVNLTDDELQMIDIGLSVACFESQLPDKGEDGFEDVVRLRKKLGIPEVT